MSAWMQKQQARSTRAAAMTSAASEDAAEHAPDQRISMYTEAPPGEVCIEDFERFAIDRLRGTVSSVASNLTITDESSSIFQDGVSVASQATHIGKIPKPVFIAMLNLQSDHPRTSMTTYKIPPSARLPVQS